VKIHPTAIVDSAATIGPDVEIGPYAVVGADVIIGDGTLIQSHVVLEGAVQIGSKNTIGHGAIIGGTPQDLGFKPATQSRVEIGDGNVIREHCTIHRGTAEGSATVIGDRNFLMAGAHLGHNCRIGNDVIIVNNCLLAGYVQVGDGAFLGGGALFHQFVRIGRLAMIQGGSQQSKDVPPFLIAAELAHVFGVNVLGLRRAGIAEADRDEIRRAFKLLYRTGLNTRQALEKAEGMKFGGAAREFFEFLKAPSKRGISSYKHSAQAKE
jgi:UDP-N-acetylglucosamine acyltransferase